MGLGAQPPEAPTVLLTNTKKLRPRLPTSEEGSSLHRPNQTTFIPKSPDQNLCSFLNKCMFTDITVHVLKSACTFSQNDKKKCCAGVLNYLVNFQVRRMFRLHGMPASHISYMSFLMITSQQGDRIICNLG